MEITHQGSKKRMVWDVNDPDEILEARETFSKFVKQGWIAAIRGEEFKRVLKFNPNHGEIWFIPIVEGGMPTY